MPLPASLHDAPVQTPRCRWIPGRPHAEGAARATWAHPLRTLRRTCPGVTSILLWAVMLTISPLALALEGRVVGVTDGDTLSVLTAQNELIKVRLSGIDAPERAQPFGARAKQKLSDLAFGRHVRLEGSKQDRYRRTVAKVMVGQRDVNLQMVEEGLAWHYRHYASEQPWLDRRSYAQAEQSARSKRAGLWQDPEPTPPWDWRRQRRPQNAR